LIAPFRGAAFCRSTCCFQFSAGASIVAGATIPDRFIGAADADFPVSAGDHGSDNRSSAMSVTASSETHPERIFNAAEIGAIAHLYRGEVYRSTIWRTRLDNTTNWAIVTMGIALSTTFSSPEASPLPLLLVGLLIAVFLGMEARRYRYFNVWRARARWMEMNFYAPIFTGEARDDSWQVILGRDYTAPRHHISFVRAAGRRLRRNYVWILAVQVIAYYGKIAIHPTPAATFAEFVDRAAVGPIAGWIVLAIGLAYNSGWLAFALGTMWLDGRKHRGDKVAMG
jgi:uncharacterized membrane protein